VIVIQKRDELAQGINGGNRMSSHQRYDPFANKKRAVLPSIGRFDAREFS
jgi:hypothetical protein